MTNDTERLYVALDACQEAMTLALEAAAKGRPLTPMEAHAFKRAAARARILVMSRKKPAMPSIKRRVQAARKRA